MSNQPRRLLILRRTRDHPAADPPARCLDDRPAAAVTVVDWIDERASLSGGTRWLLFRHVPRGTNWAYTLGSATLIAFLSQAVTGVFLAMYYRPDASGGAYESVRHITDDVFLGQLVRGMHKWGASVMIVLIFLHMGRVFVYGAGPEFGATTLSRFYAIHMIVIPVMIAILITVHLYLVAKLGTTAPPWARVGGRPDVDTRKA
jgi:quinol-cytochrome oxidoreductase complex cytochrome b subunit